MASRPSARRARSVQEDQPGDNACCEYAACTPAASGVVRIHDRGSRNHQHIIILSHVATPALDTLEREATEAELRRE